MPFFFPQLPRCCWCYLPHTTFSCCGPVVWTLVPQRTFAFYRFSWLDIVTLFPVFTVLIDCIALVDCCSLFWFVTLVIVGDLLLYYPLCHCYCCCWCWWYYCGLPNVVIVVGYCLTFGLHLFIGYPSCYVPILHLFLHSDVGLRLLVRTLPYMLLSWLIDSPLLTPTLRTYPSSPRLLQFIAFAVDCCCSSPSVITVVDCIVGSILALVHYSLYCWFVG